MEVVAFELTHGTDFLAHKGHIACDLVLCNPPFNNDVSRNKVFVPELFLAKILEVAGEENTHRSLRPNGNAFEPREEITALAMDA